MKIFEPSSAGHAGSAAPDSRRSDPSGPHPVADARGHGGSASVPETVPSAPAAPRKILLAEDERLTQILAVRYLERLGHQVTVAHNGRDAVELAAAEAFDLVFMDMHMPLLSGIEATRAIRHREQSTRERIPVIALTASDDPRDRELCLAAGMDDFASKPLRERELVAVIGRFALAPLPKFP